MSWPLFRWTWQLESPLYVGATPAGSLNRCRLYVPARALWGAFTAELARMQAESGDPQYQKFGEQLKQEARFTYLYPAEKLESKWGAWLPYYQAGEGLIWRREIAQDTDGFRTDRQMRMELLSTQPGTAIEPSSHTAAEGTLRELEYILPRWRHNASPVAFVGYVFLKDARLQQKVQEIREIMVGGETRYGFGRLRRCFWERAGECFGIATDLSGEQPTLEGPKFVLAHTLSECGGVEVGAREILRGWDVDFLLTAADAEPCWVPGSQASDGNKFSIRWDGLWERIRSQGSCAA